MSKIITPSFNTKDNLWDSVKRFDSKEGNVVKFVFDAYPNAPAVAEAVLYRYPSYKERTVICCSVQSGCPIGCRFCGTSEYFVRSLTADEIVSQVKHALDATDVLPNEIQKLQIMFMSMGEPALNQTNLCDAICILNRRYPNAALLISTSCPDVHYDEIFTTSKSISKVGLQFSIHESTDENRAKLIPFKKRNTLEAISKIGKSWYDYVNKDSDIIRKPFFNYCAHDLNSSVEDADRLYKLFDPSIWEATVSVVCERNEGMPTRNTHQVNLAHDFASKLLNAGFNVRTFDPAGQDDIGGGCGQLWYVQDKMKEMSVKNIAKKTAGFGLPIIHTPRENK